MNGLISLLSTLTLVTNAPLSLANNNLTTNHSSQEHKPILVGYWHNWDNGAGYQGGTAKYLDLANVPQEYDFINVSNVSFMKSYKIGEIPTFIPEVPHKTQFTQIEKNNYFTNQVKLVQERGQKVILSLGVADAHIDLKIADLQPFTEEIMNLISMFGFDGIDIDLEQAAIADGENEYIIPQVLMGLKDHYAKNNKEFLITMAPEFPYLRTNSSQGKYLPYLKTIGDYLDFVSPQFYNQAGDGVNVPLEEQEALGFNGWWLTQNDAKYKAEFLYLIAKYIVQGEDNFYQIPADKLLGLPANNDAAANGQVKQHDIKKATDLLKEQNIYLKGMMTWSVNWDAVTAWEFIKTYQNEFYQ
ncbi:MAG: chitinase [Spiroplasma poulsonii]|uniref:Chitinase D n=2 Tax=Spiroplasma poulsonii TaxID=2138 RepID=A0A2P6FC62_9MOLU|nr:glycosyl hydrolase family 18 protein [Spiroplasma poulsonii]KAF0851453.1 Chitinase D precursor [Spiroplasma poulsonii]MBW1241535.1 chitinase [Spiroplasma poulsonii]PQM31047.1 Chitinase D precursor [Spiroplasma poulsonii]PWF96046.1 Chitinase D precursor [Spiroplasma poulsonii]PWF98820.1 Chitinase D precursor [Spiroplasma poulsonii]